MCISADFNKVKAATFDITAFKKVVPCYDAPYAFGSLGFCSMHPPERRVLQHGGFWNRGCVVTYEIGKKVRSPIPGTPGLYCYQHMQVSRRFVILKVKIPKGARFVEGLHFGDLTLNAEEIIPMEVM